MDNEHFWKLLKPVHSEVAAFCRKLSGDRDAGDDLYQDSLLKAMRKFGSLNDHNAFRSWLFRIVVNGFKNRCRRNWWRRTVQFQAHLPGLSQEYDPRETYDRRRKLNQILSVLSAEDRALIVLYEIEGWQIAELARMFKRPEGTIKTRLYRARTTLREKLERYNAKSGDQESSNEVVYALQRSKTTDI